MGYIFNCVGRIKGLAVNATVAPVAMIWVVGSPTPPFALKVTVLGLAVHLATNIVLIRIGMVEKLNFVSSPLIC